MTLVEKQIKGMIVKGNFEKLKDFSSFKETMVVAIVGNKGGSDKYAHVTCEPNWRQHQR
jgi:hypothetical protein